jgi:hypothetical protein
VVYLVDAGGQVGSWAGAKLAHDFPVLFEHKDWWVSPVLHAVVSLPEILIEKGVVPDHGASRFAPLLLPRPAPAWAAMIVLALASCLAAPGGPAARGSDRGRAWPGAWPACCWAARRCCR